jgi:type IV pilus assembly protein PilA
MRTAGDEGFSLIELLVAMLVLGMLAAVATPVFLHQRQKAYQAAMQSDLRTAVAAELAYRSSNDAWATEPTALHEDGYRTTTGVTPVHLKVADGEFQACVKHRSITEWLVYDSSTGDISSSGSDCAA